MNASRSIAVLFVLSGLAFPLSLRAETHTVSWNPVTTYIDGTPIEISQEVSYAVFWSTDPALPSAGLRELASSVTESYASFDPDAAGMPRGQTVYFTARSTLRGGEVSSLSAPRSWPVPLLAARLPDASSGLAIAGPISDPVPGSYRLSWSPVTRYADGASFDAGTTATYRACWTQDPMFFPGTLRTLGDGIGTTAYAFDPVASGMTGYQTVYFVVTTVLGSGAESALSDALAWTVPSSGPAAPGTPAVTRLAPGSANPYQLSWNAVTTYANGRPLEPGLSVNYQAFWTTDPALSIANLRPLGATVATPTVAFDPSAAGMINYQRVFFAVRSVLPGGAESSLSPELSWRVSNKGPLGPANGKIRKTGY